LPGISDDMSRLHDLANSISRPDSWTGPLSWKGHKMWCHSRQWSGKVWVSSPVGGRVDVDIADGSGWQCRLDVYSMHSTTLILLSDLKHQEFFLYIMSSRIKSVVPCISLWNRKGTVE
jgi:hypothetical protein